MSEEDVESFTRALAPVTQASGMVSAGVRPPIADQVLESRGAVRILGIGSAIETVPDHEIESIRRMLANNTPCSRHEFLREGIRVRVRRGALKGLTGILVRLKNRTRIVVAVQLLQQAVAADVDADDVEALDVPGQGDAATAALQFAAHHSR